MIRITINEERPQKVHLPGNSGENTLCGWWDVPYKETTNATTCPVCLNLVAYCRSLSLKPEEENIVKAEVFSRKGL